MAVQQIHIYTATCIELLCEIMPIVMRQCRWTNKPHFMFHNIQDYSEICLPCWWSACWGPEAVPSRPSMSACASDSGNSWQTSSPCPEHSHTHVSMRDWQPERWDMVSQEMTITIVIIVMIMLSYLEVKWHHVSPWLNTVHAVLEQITIIKLSPASCIE